MSYLVFYITNPSKAHAEKIAGSLLKQKLVACANIFPVKSGYLWKGKVAKASEWVCILKTTRHNAKEVEAQVKKMHSDKVPCIARFKAKANKEYEDWLSKELNL